jgi:ABC-type transporter Mla subunit MlaD
MALTLMLLSVLAVLLLVGVLVFFLIQINSTLERIGGRSPAYSSRQSLLSKIAFGVRAIEQQTGHLGPEVTRLNATLDQAAAGLVSVDRHLGRTIDAVSKQGSS